MQISLEWINELVATVSVKLDHLIEKLTLAGFEVEEVLKVEINKMKYTTLDISATANRSDSLSIQGLSAEIAALLNSPINSSTYSIKSLKLKQMVLENARILPSDSDCSLLSSVIIENLTDLTVPKWIKRKLICSGVEPSGDLKDFQSYILLESGYPLAFYDFDKISEQIQTRTFNLSVSNATNNQYFRATNDQEYKLDDNILLIEANRIPISIAGIIENQDFIYSENTKSLLIEGSIFNAARIRQQSRSLGVRTDRSIQYEKSLKNTSIIESLYRLILLLRISNPDIHVKFQTVAKTIEQSIKPIKLKYSTTQEILGPINKLPDATFEYISSETIEDYLNRLGFEFTYDKLKQDWEVNIPSHRSDDITREIDLIEEVGRLHGFNNFLITLPKLRTVGIEDSSYKTRRKITSCLLNFGLNEFIHYSLVNEKTFLTNEVKLINPSVSEYSNLRLSLLPSLVRTIQENLKQSNSVINGFEYGHVFFIDEKNQLQETERIAGIFGGAKTKLTWSDFGKELTWFEAKGNIEQLFKQLNLNTIWKVSTSNNLDEIFHNSRVANICLESDVEIGVFGQIHPILANNLDISSQIYLFEFNIEVIQSKLETNKLAIYKEYSSYPKIIKDISFIVREDIEFENLRKVIYFNGSRFLSKINLLDEYKGKSIPDKHISLCCQLTFQSNEKTLQNREVEEILNNIRFILSEEFAAIIRN